MIQTTISDATRITTTVRELETAGGVPFVARHITIGTVGGEVFELRLFSEKRIEIEEVADES